MKFNYHETLLLYIEGIFHIQYPQTNRTGTPKMEAYCQSPLNLLYLLYQVIRERA